MKRKTLIQLIMLLGEGLMLVISVAFIYILISRKAGTEVLGQYSLVLAWATLFQVIGSFGIPELMIRELGSYVKKESKYISHGLLIGMCFSFIAMIVMAFFILFFPYAKEIKKALFLSTFTLIPVMVTTICRGGFLARKKTGWIFFISILESLTIVSINVYLIINGHGVVSLILTIIGGKILSSLLSLYFLNKHAVKLQFQWDDRFARKLLPLIFTFAISTFLWVLNKRVNVIMISIWKPISTVGFYSAANALLEASMLIPVLFGQLLLPQFAHSFIIQKKYDIKQYEGMLYLLFGLSIPLGVGILFFAKPIVELLFGEQFLDSILILRVLMLYFIIECADSIMGLILKAAGHQKADVRIFSINAGTNIILSIFLIPLFGGLGAALSKTAGAICSLVLRNAFISTHFFKLGWLRITAKPFLISSVLAACMVILSEYVNVFILGVIYVFLSALAFLFMSGFSIRNMKIASHSE